MEWLTREASAACSGNNPTCQMHCLYSMLQPFLFLSFFWLRKLTSSRLPRVRLFITADQFGWGVSLLFAPLRPYGTSAVLPFFGIMYLRKLIPYIIIMLNLGLKQLWKALPAVWRLMMGRQLDSGSGSLGVSLPPQSVLTPAADPQPPTPPPGGIKLPSHMSSDSAALPVARPAPPLPSASPILCCSHVLASSFRGSLTLSRSQ